MLVVLVLTFAPFVSLIVAAVVWASLKAASAIQLSNFRPEVGEVVACGLDRSDKYGLAGGEVSRTLRAVEVPKEAPQIHAEHVLTAPSRTAREVAQLTLRKFVSSIGHVHHPIERFGSACLVI